MLLSVLHELTSMSLRGLLLHNKIIALNYICLKYSYLFLNLLPTRQAQALANRTAPDNLLSAAEVRDQGEANILCLHIACLVGRSED